MIPFFPSTSGKKSRIFRWKLAESNSKPRDLRRPRVSRLELCQARKGENLGQNFPKVGPGTLKVQESNLTFMVEWEMIPIPRTLGFESYVRWWWAFVGCNSFQDVFWSRFVEQGFGQILEEREMKKAWCIQVQSFVFLQEKVPYIFFGMVQETAGCRSRSVVGCAMVPCFPPHQPASSISQRREVSLRVTWRHAVPARFSNAFLQGVVCQSWHGRSTICKLYIYTYIHTCIYIYGSWGGTIYVCICI